MDICPSITIDTTLLDVVRNVTFVVQIQSGITTEGTQEESICNSPCSLSVRIQRPYVKAILHFELSKWVINLISQLVFVPFTSRYVLICWVSWIVSSCRIEHLLWVILHLTVSFTTKNTKLQLQFFVESILCSIKFYCVILHIRVLQSTLTLYETKACTIVTMVVTR